jgi:1-acyl-sn-glycerol-3-phosphate acyltransferase
MHPFRRGAAHIALESECIVLPVAITCEPPSLMKGQRWYEVPDRQIELTVRVLEPLQSKDFVEPGRSRGLAARKLTAALRERFEENLDCAGT